jgi:DNA-binding NarL/FixJ family response regulator
MTENVNVSWITAALRNHRRGATPAPPAPARSQQDARIVAHRRRTPPDRAALARATSEAQAALHEAAAAAADAAAQARSMATVLDQALAVLAATEVAPAERQASRLAPSPRVALSPRERDVLALVAEGRSNKAIAEALYVSPNTVKTHVASLLRKHDVGSRAHLAALAAAQERRER